MTVLTVAATKNIDKSVYFLEKFLVHRVRPRCPERQATDVCITLQRRKFPTSHRYILTLALLCYSVSLAISKIKTCIKVPIRRISTC